MRSLELPGTPYFIQPVTVPWSTPLFTRNHSTAREKNWFSPHTLVVRLGLLPVGLALGRWETVPEIEIQARKRGEEARSWFARYNVVNDPVSWHRFLQAWESRGAIQGEEPDDDSIMWGLQEALSDWEEPTSDQA